MWSLIFILILFTFIFFYVISLNVQITRTNNDNNDNKDGNGYFQYKGRGDSSEDINILLSRIDWLAKNNMNSNFYLIAYLIAYAILLSSLFILYAYSKYILSVWEAILILFSSYIVTFSILNLFQFHTEKYPNYYIRQNIDYIKKNYNLNIFEPPLPKSNILPHRTEIQDILSS